MQMILFPVKEQWCVDMQQSEAQYPYEYNVTVCPLNVDDKKDCDEYVQKLHLLFWLSFILMHVLLRDTA